MSTDINKLNDLLLPDDKLHLIYYLDHSLSTEDIETVRKTPFILWCCGKILNKNAPEPYLFLVNAGRLFRKRIPLEYQVIIKSCIIQIIEIHKVSRYIKIQDFEFDLNDIVIEDNN